VEGPRLGFFSCFLGKFEGKGRKKKKKNGMGSPALGVFFGNLVDWGGGKKKKKKNGMGLRTWILFFVIFFFFFDFFDFFFFLRESLPKNKKKIKKKIVIWIIDCLPMIIQKCVKNRDFLSIFLSLTTIGARFHQKNCNLHVFPI
jgi:hypothetical protein